MGATKSKRNEIYIQSIKKEKRRKKKEERRKKIEERKEKRKKKEKKKKERKGELCMKVHVEPRTKQH